MGRPKKFNRAEVLAKATPIFWEHGFADTSLQDLEKATCVNKSGLYAEFESKEELYLASLRHYLENRGTKKKLATEPLGWNNIETFLKTGQTRLWGKKGCFATNSLREFAVLPDEALKMVRASRAQLKQLVIKNIEAEQTKMDAETIADILMTIFTGLCLEQNDKLAPGSAARKVASIMQMIRSL